MRVTFIVAAVDFSGGIRVIAQYAEGLRRRGHDVLVISPSAVPYGRLARFRNQYFPKRQTYAPSHLDSTLVAINFLERYRPVRLEDVPQADVIIATWWETAEWIVAFPEDRGKKVHFVQGYETFHGNKERVDACLQLPNEKITISKWLENILVEQLETKEPFLVTNGVDAHLFSLPDRVMPEKPRLGFVHASSFYKGSDIAIRALSIAKERIPELQAIAFGHGALDPVSPFPDFIDYHISPAQSELPSIYGSCTAWIFPSREEGFGLPILEALASGTPLIATPAGAAPEILKNGGGYILDGFNADEMADKIVQMVSIEADEWKLKSSECLRIANNHSLEKSIDKFESALIEISKKF